MPLLSLARFRWTLMSERDAGDVDANIAPGRDRLEGGYRQAASAQTIYFEPGSLAQARILKRALTRLGADFPSVLDAERVFREIRVQVPHYAFEATGKTWCISNISDATFGSPLGKRDMRLYLETADPPPSIRIPAASVHHALSLFERLSGGASVDAAAEFATEHKVGALLGALLAGGMLETGQSTTTENADLPDFLFLGHSSFAVRARDKFVVFDPVMLPGNSAAGDQGRLLSSLIRDAAAIVISHHHWDHLHFQTLVRLPRNIPLIVPVSRRPSFANPPIAAYLRSLGFTDISERAPGDTAVVAGVAITFFPFFGESFGLQSHFDAFTYHVSFSGRTLYGSVDACFDEAETMEATIAAVAEMGTLDFFLFGSSGQHHLQPFAAGAPRHFSNELEDAPELLRYHPTVADVARWSKILNPSFLVPYATFDFESEPRQDLRVTARNEVTGPRLKVISRDLVQLGMEVRTDILSLSPMQGIWLN